MKAISTFLFALLVTCGVACSDVEFVDTIEFANEGAYPARVSVRGGGEGWLRLPTVEAHGTRVVQEVIDQGDTWTFRFSYAGRAQVDSTFSRESLHRADWRVEVPSELEERLRRQGVTPPP